MTDKFEQQPPRVVISNAYADDNRGGAALTAAAVEMARRALPGCAVTLIAVDSSADPQRAFRHTLNRHPDVEVVPPPFPRMSRLGFAPVLLLSLAALVAPRLASHFVPSLRRIREARLVIGKGGQVFRDFPLSGLPGLWLTSFPLLFATRLGRPAVAFGVSIGPYTRGHPAASWLAGAVLRRLTCVFARGDYSAQLARQLGVAPSRVIDIPDTVFSLRPPDERRTTALVQRLGLRRGCYLAITISETLGGSDHSPAVFPVLRDLVCDALETPFIDEILVVVQTDGHRTSDAAASQAFVTYVDDSRVRLVAEDLPFLDLMALYGAAAATIGGRVHSAVFSVVAGAPAFPLEGGGQKAREIFGRFGQEERALLLFEESAADMFSKLSAVIQAERKSERRIADELRGEFDRVARDLKLVVGANDG